MQGRDAILNLLEEGLASSRADQTEIALTSQRLSLTRFAQSQVNQNVEEESGTLSVRAWHGDGMGVVSTQDVSPDGLRDALRRAGELATMRGGDGVTLPEQADYASIPTFYEATAHCGVDRRLELCTAMIDHVGELEATGNVRTAVQEFAVVNSRGLRAYIPMTYAAAVIVARTSDGATGHGSIIHRDVMELDVEQVARRAAHTAGDAQNAVSLPAGNYTVVLDPPALAWILFSLGLFGFGAFGATAAEQGRSFVAEHMGEIVAAPAFSLWDDALDPAGLPMPFDAEGVPKQRVDLIKSGRAAGVCFNLATAKRAGRSSTGHALPAPNPQGPLPYSLVMAAGEASRQDLIGGIRRGLLISRCHGFIAPLNSRNGTLSGTTRDGTFLVEGGEIVAPVKNFRWTVSAVDTFKTLEAASSERSLEFNDLFGFFPTTSLLPSVRLGRFRIDGVQPHE